MTDMKSCPECNSPNVRQYARPVPAAGGYGPDLLPELRKSMFSSATFLPVLCLDCGLIRLYASPEARKKASNYPHWKEL